MKQIDVQIMQQSYVLTCPDGQEERVQEAVRRVDEAMTRIRDSGKVRSRERVAVLAALNMAFDVLDRDAQQALMANAQAEMQAHAQEQFAPPRSMRPPRLSCSASRSLPSNWCSSSIRHWMLTPGCSDWVTSAAKQS